MKALLIPIQPQWCELIASGKKTIEARKTRPKIETPFKCYIYQTKRKAGLKYFDQDSNKLNDFLILRKCGKVIGSFVCDRIICCQAYYDDSGKKHLTNLFGVDTSKICLSELEIFDYIIGKDKKDGIGWLWHISDLKIYDKPKELGEFYTLGNCEKYDFCNQCKNFHRGQGWLDGSYFDEDSCLDNTRIPVTRAPWSWMYVEELL